MLGGDKTVAWDDVEWVKALQPTLRNGRWRLSGSGNFTTWFATDAARPARETIFLMKLRTQAVKVGFTVHDAPRVKRLLAERGVLIDEQGDARPTPLPVETRPFWRWPGLYAVIAVLIALAAEIAYFHPRLPAMAASHFNFRGHADAFMSRNTLIGIIAAAAVTCAATFVVLAFRMSRTRAATFGPYFLWWGAATLALVLVMAHLCFRANFVTPPSTGYAPLYALLAYFAVVAAGAVVMIRRLT